MALRRITLRDFVIVKSLELDLSGGFTVLTGETGAGKSILIDALQLTMGERGDSGLVREGALKADICSELDCPPHIKPWLENAGIEPDDLLLLRRTVDLQGKSRAWINGVPATITQLRKVGDLLIDIHGQHAWHSLTRPDSVRELLDAFSGVSAAEVNDLWSQWRISHKQLEQASESQSTLHQERERIQWQISELEKLSPLDGEWFELEGQHKRLSHAQALKKAAQSSLLALQEDDSGVLERLAAIESLLRDNEHIEPLFGSLKDILSSSIAQARDVAHSLQSYLRYDSEDPERLAEFDARISLWMTLARKFRRQPEDLPSLLETWKAELQRLDTATDLAGLISHEQLAASQYLDAARTLSRARVKAAPQLSVAITKAMQGLGMQGGSFEAIVSKSAAPAAHGLDDVTFLVAGHPGMSPKPIGKIASGGELSRISLAISVTTSQLGVAPTLIFDEVDSGVGGAVAENVGRLLKQLGIDRQVLAVTHLPQVAACADQQLTVTKNRDSSGTWSSIRSVQGDSRVTELARMLGGERPTTTTLAHARELLGNACIPTAAQSS